MSFVTVPSKSTHPLGSTFYNHKILVWIYTLERVELISRSPSAWFGHDLSQIVRVAAKSKRSSQATKSSTAANATACPAKQIKPDKPQQQYITTMNEFCIGSDILDLGSRRAEARNKRLREFEAQLQNEPTHFDVPNVSDVRDVAT